MVTLKTLWNNARTFASRDLSAQPDTKRRRVLQTTNKTVSATKMDIKLFKEAEALSKGDEPKNYAIQMIMEEAKRDALLTSQINNRKQQSFSIPFSLKKPNGEIDVEQTDILKKLPLYRFLTHAMLDSIYHEYSMVELKFVNTVTGSTILIGESIPRTNIVPQTGLFYPDYGDDISKIPYRELPEFGIWLLEYRSQEGALLNKAVPHVVFKRFAQSCWAELCEIYGIPPRWLKTNTQDADMLARAEQMMKDMGSAAWSVIDETEEFGFAQGATTNGDVYSNLITLCRNELCLLIVGAVIGQDTKNGNRSKETSSQELLWYLVQSDLAMLEEYWNTINIPALQKHGILKGDLTFCFDEAEDLNKLWEMVTAAWKKYKIPAKWIAEKFGIPVEEIEAKKTDPEKAKKKGKNDPQPEDETDTEELGFFVEAPSRGANWNKLAHQCCGNHITLALPDNGYDIKKIIAAVKAAEGKSFLYPELFNHNAKTLLQGFESGWNAGGEIKLSDIGFMYDFDDPKLQTAWELNLFQFSTVKAAAQSAEVNALFRKAKSFRDFEVSVNYLFGVDKKDKLRTEYDTANAVGTSASTYYRLLKSTSAFKYWEYLTVLDKDVRHEHALMHGCIFRWDDPIWDKIFPPNGWNCRCYIVARMEHEVTPEEIQLSKEKGAAFISSKEFKMATKAGFGINRANTKEVFTASQSYSKTPDKVLEHAGKLLAEDWGLKPIKERQEQATAVFEPAEDRKVIEEFFKKHKATNRRMKLTDYANRDIDFAKNRLYGHTRPNDAYKDRYQYLNELANVLTKPDEVWINDDGSKFDTYTYIRYYKNEILKVVTTLNKSGDLEVSTWYAIDTEDANVIRHRRGIVIKK